MPVSLTRQHGKSFGDTSCKTTKKKKSCSLHPNIRRFRSELSTIKTYQTRTKKEPFYWVVKQTMSQNTICTTQSSGLNPDLAPFFFNAHSFQCLAHCDFPARRHQTTAARNGMPLSLNLRLSSSLCCRRCRRCDSRAVKAKLNKSQILPLVKSIALPAHSCVRPDPIPSKPASAEPR